MRVMTKELIPFNVRTLTVELGMFDTNFTADLKVTETPFPEDYRGSMTEKVTTSLQGTNFNPDGDHRKASKVIYEMVTGEGFGAGKENETVMILGRNMWACMEGVVAKTKHMMDTFGDICNNVYLDK